MLNPPPAPIGWSTKRRNNELDIDYFNSDDELNLPKPYKPLLCHLFSPTILIQCGDNPREAHDPKRFCYVLWNDISDVVALIVSPTEINQVYAALSFYGTSEDRTKGPKLRDLTHEKPSEDSQKEEDKE